ncbi:MAG: hypothetical protein WAU07_02570 [Microgenomates group bacterium]
MNKRVLLPVVAAIIAGTLFGAGQVSAHGLRSTNSTSLIQALTQRFNLNEKEVQAVFEEVRQQQRSQRQTHMENRLQVAVDSGDLTEEQRDSLITLKEEHMKAMQEHINSSTDFTPEQRTALFEKHRAELEAWAEQEGVSLDDVVPFHDRFGSHRRMMEQ